MQNYKTANWSSFKLMPNNHQVLHIYKQCHELTFYNNSGKYCGMYSTYMHIHYLIVNNNL